MNENEIERLLHQLTPAGPTPALEARIADALSCTPAPQITRISLSDRFLLATISAGLIAACLIVTLLTLDSTNRAPSTPQNLSNSPPALENQRLLAQLMRGADAHE